MIQMAKHKTHVETWEWQVDLWFVCDWKSAKEKTDQ